MTRGRETRIAAGRSGPPLSRRAFLTGTAAGGAALSLVGDLGSDSFVYGHLADDPESTVIIRAGREHPPGEVGKAGVDASRLHLFDAATGLRVGDYGD